MHPELFQGVSLPLGSVNELVEVVDLEPGRGHRPAPAPFAVCTQPATNRAAPRAELVLPLRSRAPQMSGALVGVVTVPSRA